MRAIFRSLWPHLLPYRARFLVVVVFGVCISSFKLGVVPQFEAMMVSWTDGNKDSALIIPLIIAAAWTASCILTYFHLYWMKTIGEKIALKLRQNLMDKYLSLNLGFVQKFQTGSGGLISRMLNDIYIIHDGINNIAAVVREPVMIFGILGYILYKDWKLTILIVICLPIIGIAMRKIAKSLRKYGHLNQESMEGLSKTLKESLDGSRIVQSFNLESEMNNRFEKQANTYLSYRKKNPESRRVCEPFFRNPHLNSFTSDIVLHWFQYYG